MVYYVLIIVAFAVFLLLALRHRSGDARTHEGQAGSISLLDLVVTLLATAIGGGLIFGLIQFGRSAGMIGLLLGVVYCLSFIGLGLLAPTIRATVTRMSEDGLIPEGSSPSLVYLLTRKYNPPTWGLVLLGYQFVYVGFLAAQFVALGRIVQAMGISISVPIIMALSAATVLLYVSMGGFRAVIGTEYTQLLVLIVILVLSIFAVGSQGGIAWDKLPPEYWNPFRDQASTSMFVWLAAFIFPSLLLRLDHWQRIVAAKSDSDARRGYVIAGFLLTLVFGALLAVGASATAEGSSSPFFLFEKHFLAGGGFGGQLLYGLVLVAFLCAIMSSADTVLNASAAALLHTLRGWGLVTTRKAYPIICASFGITLAAWILAFMRPDVVGLITEGFKIMTILLPTIVAALILKRPSDAAGTLSLIGGIGTYLAVKYTADTIGQWSYVLGFVAAFIILMIVYRIERVVHKNSTEGKSIRAEQENGQESGRKEP